MFSKAWISRVCQSAILQHAGRLIFVTAAYAVVQLDLRRLPYA
jgi:hypothetical protein